jgi:uncharacterized protein
MSKIERRFSGELRAANDSGGDEMALVGYASIFNEKSEDLGGFREICVPGAFSRAIREKSDVRALVNHSPDLVLGRVKNSSLHLEEDARGLKFRVVLPPTQQARDIHALVKRGDIDACSFAFIAREQSWEDTKDEKGEPLALRKLMDVDLRDVSIVTNPAYPQTSVSARALFPDGEPVEVRSEIDKRKKTAEVRAAKKEMSYQDLLDAVQGALCQSFGYGNGGWMRYWACETYEDHVIAADTNDPDCFYDIPYQMAKDGTITFGQMTPVEQAWVPSERVLRAVKGERRGAETQPPEGPYAIALPQPFDSDMKQEWWDAFMEEYKDATKRRKLRGQEAIAAAIAHANLVIQPKTEVDPEVKGQGPNPTPAGPAEIVDTDTGKSSGGDDSKKSAAAPNPNRTAGAENEIRIYKSVDDIPDYIPKAKAKQWMEVWNSAYKAAKKDGKSDKDAETLAFKEANGVIKKGKSSADPNSNVGAGQGTLVPDNAGNTAAKDVSDPASPNYDPDDENYDEELDTSTDEREGREGELRDGKKTKRVDGADLTDDCFAFVGDPDKVATWKLPIKFPGDEEKTKRHIRNAIARFGQTKGIPADKKDAVWKKIVAAAKKYDIKVSEEDSVRAGVAHDVTVTAINEQEAEATLSDALRMRQRLVDIEITI